MTTQTVEVPADRLVALRLMAWAGVHLLGAMARDDEADFALEDDELSERGFWLVEHHAVEDAREAMNGLQFGNGIMDGYETLSIGPTLDEFKAMQQEEGSPMSDEKQAFEGHVVLELMGHRRLGGLLTEQVIGGTSFLRIDVPGPDGEQAATQFYNPAAVYAITPTTPEIARAVALANQPAPVQRWELPALKASAPSDDDPAELGEDQEDDDDRPEWLRVRAEDVRLCEGLEP